MDGHLGTSGGAVSAEAKLAADIEGTFMSRLARLTTWPRFAGSTYSNTPVVLGKLFSKAVILRSIAAVASASKWTLCEINCPGCRVRCGGVRGSVLAFSGEIKSLLSTSSADTVRWLGDPLALVLPPVDPNSPCEFELMGEKKESLPIFKPFICTSIASKRSMTSVPTA
jgi:hypothetical protein